MRVLLRVVMFFPALTLLGVTGCSQFNESLGHQTAHVAFAPGTPNQVRLQVRAACGQLPDVTPAPVAKDVPLSSALSEVVYQIDNANPADVARLQVCLQKFKSVTGISLSDSTDTG